MNSWKIVAIALAVTAGILLLGALVVWAVRLRRSRITLRDWWKTHKPTKRRLIQVYVALLCNANIKGYLSGTIFKGPTKYLCVPGLNCYSCPGAVGACPLGALQNAFAQSNTRAPFYVLGILLLYGLLFARTVCGFLCPVGLGQELLFKIKSPKLKKSKVTYILSYFKYVLLAVLVVAVPLLYSRIQSKVPAFCEFICPAGTFGGGLGLLLNPANADFYGMLGGLFTWKFAVMVCVIAACIFIYRFFCRFFCPLGAIYGFFNRIALLGVKLDENKCTDCGLCVERCKMDIRHVGDHECINCGECIDVCPAKAIRWKGSKLFVHAGAAEAPASEELPAPLTSLVHREGVPNEAAETARMMQNEVADADMVCLSSASLEAQAADAAPSEAPSEVPSVAPERLHRKRLPWAKLCCYGVAAVLLIGAFLGYNVIYPLANVPVRTYVFTVNSRSGRADVPLVFELAPSEGCAVGAAVSKGGQGTESDPFVLDDMAGRYEIYPNAGADGTSDVYYTCTLRGKSTVTVRPVADGELSSDLSLKVFYMAGGVRMTVFDIATAESLTFTLDPAQAGVAGGGGNKVGDLCYDFSLKKYGEEGNFTLSEHRGKIVVINFWATWCGGCVDELPAFQRVKEEFGDAIEIVAVHGANVTEDVQNFLDSKQDKLQPDRVWSDWQIIFVQDTGSITNSEVYSLLGGRVSWPMTVIVNAEGRITFIQQGSLSYDALRAQLNAILG